MKLIKKKDYSKPYNITSVCKGDLLGFEKQLKNGKIVSKFTKKQIDSLTDSDMERLASKLANDYCEQLFWSSLEILTEHILEAKKYEK
jgi:hypothetical protein